MDTLFFWTSKLAWMLLSPDGLLLLFVVTVWGLLKAGRILAAYRLSGFLAGALCCIALFPVDEWLIQPIENTFRANPPLPTEVHGIILLGGAEQEQRARAWGQPELNEGADRYFAFLALARAYPQAKLVFTGGSGKLMGQEVKEADMAADLLRSQGLDLSRVTFESRSRNTAENAASAMKMVQPGAGEKWVLVTSAFHMPRAIGGFCKAGWAVIPYPVDHRSEPGRLLRMDLDLAGHLARLHVAAREWTGLVGYYVLGRTERLLPASCDDA